MKKEQMDPEYLEELKEKILAFILDRILEINSWSQDQALNIYVFETCGFKIEISDIAAMVHLYPEGEIVFHASHHKKLAEALDTFFDDIEIIKNTNTCIKTMNAFDKYLADRYGY